MMGTELVLHSKPKPTRSEVEQLRAQLDAVTFEYESDVERAEAIDQRLRVECVRIMARVEELRASVREQVANAADSLELSEQVAEAKTLLDVFEGTHTSVGLEDAADEMSMVHLKSLAHQLYLALCRFVHPDKNPSVDPNLFHEVQAAYKACDVTALRLMLASMYEDDIDESLVAALNAKIEQVISNHRMFKETDVWFYYEVNINDGYSTALGMFREELMSMIEALESTLNDFSLI